MEVVQQYYDATNALTELKRTAVAYARVHATCWSGYMGICFVCHAHTTLLRVQDNSPNKYAICWGCYISSACYYDDDVGLLEAYPVTYEKAHHTACRSFAKLIILRDVVFEERTHGRDSTCACCNRRDCEPKKLYWDTHDCGLACDCCLDIAYKHCDDIILRMFLYRWVVNESNMYVDVCDYIMMTSAMTI